MAKAVVTFDGYNWTDEDGSHHAVKGDEIEVSSDELDRGKELGALAVPGSDEAKAAASGEEVPAEAEEPQSVIAPGGEEVPVEEPAAEAEPAPKTPRSR
jgi:hypothetical protein